MLSVQFLQVLLGVLRPNSSRNFLRVTVHWGVSGELNTQGVFFLLAFAHPTGAPCTSYYNINFAQLTTTITTTNDASCIPTPHFCLVCGDIVPKISCCAVLNLKEDPTTKRQSSYEFWFVFRVILLIQQLGF